MEVKNHGFIVDDIVDGDHYILGGYKSIGGAVLNPSRDWTKWLPIKPEYQNLNNIEPFACTNFGTLNCVEILINKLIAEQRDYSDRYFAKTSGTDPALGGNSPHMAAEYLRKNGVVLQSKWTNDVKTLDDFYAAVPGDLYLSARDFNIEFEFGHEWIIPDAKTIYDGLQFSPIGFSVFAWEKDPNGIYYKPVGQSDTHWCSLVGAEWGKYWLILDSYADENQPLKKVRWDALPMRAKRYSLRVRTKEEKQKDLNLLQQILAIYQKVAKLFNANETKMEPEIVVEKTRGDILYEVAYSCIGRDASPADTVPDSVACVESLNEVYKKAFGGYIATGAPRVSTNALYKFLLSDSRFRKVDIPMKGDIIISPTGYGNGSLSNGHAGVVGKTHIMSNDSATGTWEPNYTIDTWKRRYVDKGGFPMVYFRIV